MKTLTLIDKAFLLKKTLLFNALDLDLLLTISDKMGVTECQAGEILFQIEQEAHRMYFIIEGQMEILDRHNQLLASLKEGDFFGDESIFNEKRRDYCARGLSFCTLLTLSRSHLMTIISEYPGVALVLLQAYAAAMPFRLPKISGGTR